MTDAEEEAFVAEIVPKIRKLSSGRLRIMDAASESMGRARGGWGKCVRCLWFRSDTERLAPVCHKPIWGDNNVYMPPHADFGCSEYEAMDRT